MAFPKKFSAKKSVKKKMSKVKPPKKGSMPDDDGDEIMGMAGMKKMMKAPRKRG